MKKVEKVKRIILGLCAFLLMSGISARAGIVKGKIVESETGNALVGAMVVTQNGLGAEADINGFYSIDLKPGIYTLTVVYIGYKTEVKENITVTKDELTIDFLMIPDGQILDGASVVGMARHNNEIAVIREQKESNVTMTGVSEQQIRRTQDKDAGEVIRRIPGVSIIDEKFVMVRGLSQRYNNVWMNGAAVPSSEADQRAFSFDIIPSSQLDNMKIVKSAAPEYPADFSGGFILVNTKDIPSDNKTDFSIGTAWNDRSHFQPFLSCSKNADEYHARSSDPIGDFSASASTAQRRESESGRIWALTGSLNYSRSYRNYSNMQNNLFGAYDVTHDRSNYLRQMTDNQFNINSRLGGLANIAYLSASGRTRFELKQIVNFIGKDRYTDRDGYDAQSDHVHQAEYYEQSRLAYNAQLGGRHTIAEADKVDWNLGYSYANRDMPNRRRYSIVENNGTWTVENLNDINRETSHLGEHILSAGANWSHGFEFSDFRPQLNAGAYGELRSRSYKTQQWTKSWSQGQLPQALSGIESDTMLPMVLTTKGNFDGRLNDYELVDWSNNYDANATQGSAFVSLKLPLNSFELYGGLRFEHVSTELISNTRRQESSPLSTIYDYNDFFPSINLAYHINDEHQIRMAYGRTTNRPEFRELSSSVYYDFDLASNVQGNHNLSPAYINNLDLGWEWYPNAGEIISVSLFYKHFRDPVEWTYTVAGGTDLVYSYMNADGADNYGAELDLRKQLDFINLPQFSLSANASWIKSKVTFAEGSKEKNRPMQGQSPYLVNIGLFWNSDTGREANGGLASGWTASLLYNTIGKRLIGVGRSVGTGATEVRVPDSYEMPRHLIDFNLSKNFGQRISLRLAVRDLLAQKAVFKQFETNTPHGEVEQITRSYLPGRTVSISITYKL